MSSVKLYPPNNKPPSSSPLPQLLQTPSGLALLELQGTINLPQDANGDALGGVQVGRLDFPDFVPGTEGSAWMKRVHLLCWPASTSHWGDQKASKSHGRGAKERE
ncbi:hypothetical protein NW765_002048 [Fusarium oxysporum]|nr:hypothetical protein NW765_002048 [Fusarium oxysporum]